MRKMKLMMMAFALMLTAGAMAQSTDETQRADGASKKAMRPQRMKRMTQEQMTEKMISELKLDEKQAKKVTKLNKKFKTLIEGEQQENMKDQRPPMGQGRTVIVEVADLVAASEVVCPVVAWAALVVLVVSAAACKVDLVEECLLVAAIHSKPAMTTTNSNQNMTSRCVSCSPMNNMRAI